jgi:Leucine-rich repeat (LRR) protein
MNRLYRNWSIFVIGLSVFSFSQQCIADIDLSNQNLATVADVSKAVARIPAIPLLQHTVLDLSGNTIDLTNSTELKKLKKLLEKNRGLQNITALRLIGNALPMDSIGLQGVISQLPESLVVTEFSAHSCSLNLSGRRFGRLADITGAIPAAIAPVDVTFLNLSNNKFDSSGVSALMQGIIGQFPNLIGLNLFGNQFSHFDEQKGGPSAWSFMPSLEVLDLSGQACRSWSLLWIQKTLRQISVDTFQLPRLKALYLRDNGLGEVAIPERVFQHCPALEEIDLSGNNIGGAMDDSTFLSSATIKRLYLVGCGLDLYSHLNWINGSPALCASLEVLDVSKNKSSLKTTSADQRGWFGGSSVYQHGLDTTKFDPDMLPLLTQLSARECGLDWISDPSLTKFRTDSTVDLRGNPKIIVRAPRKSDERKACLKAMSFVSLGMLMTGTALFGGLASVASICTYPFVTAFLFAKSGAGFIGLPGVLLACVTAYAFKTTPEYKGPAVVLSDSCTNTGKMDYWIPNLRRMKFGLMHGVTGLKSLGNPFAWCRGISRIFAGIGGSRVTA